ncbi:hypothetical protein NYO98_16165 [Nocardioides sp. STR2]|uniref:Dolichyl-phosphate-mannose-protein mannosyltransferase n=1 Tax=Nocardioides pini TaxID=2975053 RepID=A0ABT4CI69_9ACTN|nr:hypothetical protein [Nocardioides pini]MCY4727824.1 hypothetical protein [Nocardioides pini]
MSIAVNADKAPEAAIRAPGLLPSVRTARIDAWFDERRVLAWTALSVLFAAVAMVVVVPAASGDGGLSPVDELWYVDAVDKASRGELVNTGDKIDSYARQVQACRGVIGYQAPLPTCGEPQPDDSIALTAVSAADIHPPTYFFLAAVAGKVIRLTGVTDDLLIGARLAGVLWLTLGLLAMVMLGRAWGAGWVVPALAAVCAGTSPLLVSTSGYLSPDALGLLVGASVLLAVSWWQKGRLPTWLLLVAAVAPAYFKVTFVLAPLIGAFLVLVAGVCGQLPWRRVMTGAAILVGGAGAGALSWQLVRGALAVADPVLHADAQDPVAFASFAKYFGYYLETIPATSDAPIPLPGLLYVAILPFSWLLLTAALGGTLVRGTKDPLLPVCWSAVTGMALGSIVMSLIVLVATGGFLIGTPRYGIALLPLFAVPLMCLRHRVVVLGLVLSACGALLSHLVAW